MTNQVTTAQRAGRRSATDPDTGISLTCTNPTQPDRIGPNHAVDGPRLSSPLTTPLSSPARMSQGYRSGGKFTTTRGHFHAPPTGKSWTLLTGDRPSACHACRVSSDGVALGPITALQSGFGVWGRLARSGEIWVHWSLVWYWLPVKGDSTMTIRIGDGNGAWIVSTDSAWLFSHGQPITGRR